MEYKQLLALVLEARNFTLFSILKEAPFKNWVTILEKVFLEAAFQRDDESACQTFGWLMQAISDRELLPILKPARFEYYSEATEADPYLPSVTRTMEMASMQRAAKACELYPRLPEFQTDTIRRLVSEEEYQKGDDRRPTLLKTRGCILREIASRCFKTPDEKESLALFDFLLDIKSRYNEEREIYLKVIQETTDNSVELSRIEKHYIHTMNRGRIDKKNRFVNADTAHILGKVWVRKLGSVKWDLNDCSGDTRSGLEKLLAMIEIMEPLSRASSGVIVYMKQIAYQVATADHEINQLMRVMKSEHGPLPSDSKRMNFVWGHISIDYNGSLDDITVKVDVSGKEVPTEDKMQDLFHLATERIQGWRKYDEERMRFSVRLKVFVHDPNAPQDKKEGGDDILFKREERV